MQILAANAHNAPLKRQHNLNLFIRLYLYIHLISLLCDSGTASSYSYSKIKYASLSKCINVLQKGRLNGHRMTAIFHKSAL